MTVRISPLRIEDAGEVLTLQRAAYVPEARRYRDAELPPLTQSLDDLLAELRSPDVLGLGARDGARLVGAVRMRLEGPVAHLGRLVVVPDRQGQGLGTLLLEESERALPPTVTEIRLFTGHLSEPTLRLYERHGYRRQQEVDAGTHRLVHLAKPLSTP